MDDHSLGLVSRVLPSAEWPRLVGLGVCAVPRPDAMRGAVLVEELGPHIVGCAVVFQTPDRDGHLDGVWVHPAFRTGRVALRLWRRVRRLLAHYGVDRACVYPTSTRLHQWTRQTRRFRVKGLFTREMARAS